jgi:spore coat protein U-like protein
VFVVAVVAFAGCTGSVADPSPPSPGTTTPTSMSHATQTPDPVTPATPSLSNETAGERAIAAEKARVRNATADWTGLTDLSFGILRPAEYEIRERNASGVFVDVTVGYSVSFSCGLSADGAATRARYVVTTDDVRLVTVRQDVGQPPGEDCDESSPAPGHLRQPL